MGWTRTLQLLRPRTLIGLLDIALAVMVWITPDNLLINKKITGK